MSKTTTNYGFIKPELTDSADITKTNSNWDAVDTQLKSVNDKVKSLDDKVDGLSTDAGDLTGVLPIAHGGTGANNSATALSNLGAAPANHTHNYAGSSSAGGAANSATKLDTARTVRTNLGSTSTASFDGTANITPGVTGTLPIANGGTGATTAEEVRENLEVPSSGDFETLKTNVTNHINSKSNPHNVTATQVGLVSLSAIGNLYSWGKYTKNPSIATITPESNCILSTGATTSGMLDISYSDTYTVANGQVILINPTELSHPTTSTIGVVKGKYVKTSNGNVYKVDANATFTNVKGSVLYELKASSGSLYELGSIVSYVTSKDSSTYPKDGSHSDGYWYKSSGRLGETPYTYGTGDLVDGESTLETGKLYFVYE